MKNSIEKNVEYGTKQKINMRRNPCVSLLFCKSMSQNKYVETSDEKSSITISLKDAVTDVFQGVVTNIQVNANKDVRTLEIEALSRTFLMDIKKKTRTFQNKNSSYGEIFNIVNGEYTNIKILDSITNGIKIDKVIVQYKETDWEFIKRLSSHFNVQVVSECQLKDIKYSIGNSECCTTYEVDKYNYSIKKALQEYRIESEIGNIWDPRRR
ncbi:contractile injection system protein, VgrG/Pvc8 family [Clostridium estertheticum]|uniref:contractile injection system protein, VgrG/Pvc8 family n=1 Tax=Clostridium estertheticum TaxID=238834 RepID=UPI001CF5C0AB|nr:contractile injection system protein, VgrG/Pvc8 family [Clostridium estertheticum]MCB2357288.1 phage late control D family protein [Clostridium estertheticum]WAG43354.1 phage late control D family protein [Clostridium estertheticum]